MFFEMSRASQDQLCMTLRTLVEEWGTERITVQMPQEWKRLGENPLGDIEVKFASADSIAICVDGGESLNLIFSLN